jgi:hypothetical protein
VKIQTKNRKPNPKKQRNNTTMITPNKLIALNAVLEKPAHFVVLIVSIPKIAIGTTRLLTKTLTDFRVVVSVQIKNKDMY